MSPPNPDKPGKVTGSCACRQITFETTTLARDITSCYCRECAKVSGTGYLTFADFTTSHIRWSKQPDIWKCSDVADRGFCMNCGSSVSMGYHQNPEVIGIVISMVDSSSETLPSPTKHIFLKEKADWVVIPEDGAPRYDTWHTDPEAMYGIKT